MQRSANCATWPTRAGSTSSACSAGRTAGTIISSWLANNIGRIMQTTGPLIDPDAVRVEVERRLRLVVKDKLPGHGINDLNFIQPTRPMSAIGG